VAKERARGAHPMSPALLKPCTRWVGEMEEGEVWDLGWEGSLSTPLSVADSDLRRTCTARGEGMAEERGLAEHTSNDAANSPGPRLGANLRPEWSEAIKTKPVVALVGPPHGR
jgi:hypothetical protein